MKVHTIPEWRSHHKVNNQIIKISTICAVGIICLSGFPTNAAPLTLDEAIEKSFAQAQLHQLKDIESGAAASRRKLAGSFPNPSVYYEHEEFGEKSFAEKTSESAIGLSTNLDFIWKRGHQIKSAGQQNEIAQHELSLRRQELEIETTRQYIEYGALFQELEQLENTKVQFNNAIRIAQAALDSGDMSKLDLRRIQISAGLLNNEILEIERSLINTRANIAGLTGDFEVDPQTQFELRKPEFTNKPEAIRHALTNRAEIKAAESYLQLMEIDHRIANLDKWPSVDLDVARIENETGQDGTFFGLSVQLPVFGKSRANNRLSMAELNKASIVLEQIERRISTETDSAYSQWNLLNENPLSQREHVQDQEELLRAFLRSSSSSFAERDISILEHLDAINGFLEASRDNIHIRKNLLLALLELHKVTASNPLTN